VLPGQELALVLALAQLGPVPERRRLALPRLELALRQELARRRRQQLLRQLPVRLWPERLQRKAARLVAMLGR
jgi:hypothetical protein